MLKKVYRKAYRAWLGRRLSEKEFHYILSELLGLKRGDSVLVHASFGNLKAGFSPKTAVEILMETVGSEGNVLMPYYPYDSQKFLESGEIFDVHSTPTRSGILSAVFSTFPEVRKSLHPIKSLAVWGKDRDYLISEHHLSQTPFDERSPYYKLLTISNSKTLGIGTYKNSFAHCAEEIIPNYPKHYSSETFIAICTDYSSNSIEVKTKTHGKLALPRYSGFFKETGCPGYKVTKHSGRVFYVSQCSPIIAHFADLFQKGITPSVYYEAMNTFQKKRHNFYYKLYG